LRLTPGLPVPDEGAHAMHGEHTPEHILGWSRLG
jgi:hypothetical protein